MDNYDKSKPLINDMKDVVKGHTEARIIRTSTVRRWTLKSV